MNGASPETTLECELEVTGRPEGLVFGEPEDNEASDPEEAPPEGTEPLEEDWLGRANNPPEGSEVEG